MSASQGCQVLPASLGCISSMFDKLAIAHLAPFGFGSIKLVRKETAMTTKTNPKKTFVTARKTGTKCSELRDMREIVSRETGVVNKVLVFDDAEVVMPGTWVIRENEFPNGLYEGQKLAAYWEYDPEVGREMFHLYEVE